MGESLASCVVLCFGTETVVEAGGFGVAVGACKGCVVLEETALDVAVSGGGER